MKDGLASNHVYKQFQDSKGFIWFTTNNGLSRFDGKEFRNFSSKDGLPDNDIFDVAEDALGRLWLCCFNGKLSYIQDSKIYTALNDPGLKIKTSGNYLKLIHFGKKLIMLGLFGDEIYVVWEDGKLKKLELGKNVSQGVSNGNCLLLRTDYPRLKAPLAYFELFDAHFRMQDSITIPVITNPKNHFHLLNILQGNANNQLVILNYNYVLRYKTSNNKLERIDSTGYTNLYETFWNTGNQIWGNSNNASIIPLKPDLSIDKSMDSLFTNMQVWNFLADREGNYWGSTPGKGVFVIPNTGFKIYENDAKLKGDNLSTLTCHNNILYAGYNYSTIKRFNDNNLLYKKHTLTPSFRNTIIEMHVDASDLYAINADEIIKLNLKTRKSNVWQIAAAGKFIVKLAEDSILYGESGGSSIMSLKSSREVKIYNERTTCGFVRNNGEIFLGTLKGVVACRRDKNNIWKHAPFSPFPGLGSCRISFIKEMDGILIIGTVQNGLIFVKDNDYEMVNLGAAFKDVNCKKLFIDKDKTLWVATFSGLFRIVLQNSIHQYHVENIGEFNGLPSNDVSDVAIINDTVYLVGPGGLCSFSITKFDSQRKISPPLLITDVIVNTVSQSATKREIALKPDSNNVEIKFSALDFKSMGNIRFKYRMIGLNNDWQFTLNNFVRFESLLPGDYRFELMAMNSRNSWTKNPLVINISVLPHYWQTLWFRLMLVFTALAVAVLAVRAFFLQKHKKELKEATFKRQLIEVELKAIKAQINPHFIFNTLNAVQHFVSVGQNVLAENYLSRLAKLIRKTLDFSNRTYVPLSEEIEYLNNYLQLESLRFDTDFKYKILNQLDGKLNSVEIPPMVLQPHIENALRHGLKNKESGIKELFVRFSLAGKNLVCEVEDNGVGRIAVKANRTENSLEHASVGLELSQSKLLIFEQLTGKKVSTEIIDLYISGTKIARGTLVRVFVEQKS